MLGYANGSYISRVVFVLLQMLAITDGQLVQPSSLNPWGALRNELRVLCGLLCEFFQELFQELQVHRWQHPAVQLADAGTSRLSTPSQRSGVTGP